MSQKNLVFELLRFISIDSLNEDECKGNVQIIKRLNLNTKFYKFGKIQHTQKTQVRMTKCQHLVNKIISLAEYTLVNIEMGLQSRKSG